MREDRIDELQGKMERLMHAAETGEQWAEICSIEAEIISAKRALMDERMSNSYREHPELFD